MQNLVNNSNLVTLIVYLIADELVLIHHIVKIGIQLKKNSKKKSTKVVGLHGIGPVVSVARIWSDDDLYDKSFIQSMNVPSDDDFETFESPADFKNLRPSADKKNTRCFRNLVLLPPFAFSAILSISSTDPASMAQDIAAASQNVQDEIKDDDDFMADE